MISTRRVGSRSSSRTSYEVSRRASMSARRTALRFARDESQNTERSSAHSRTARVPSAVTRLRKSSRTIGQMLVPDAVDRGLGVSGQGPADPADVVIRLAGEETGLAVALLPEPGGGEGQERQRTALALHLGQHLVHQVVVLEAVTALHRRLHECAAKGRACRRIEQAVISVENGASASKSRAPHPEVVAHAEQHVDIGLEHAALSAGL